MIFFFFFFKQKTAYEMFSCDWSSDVCSSDLFTDELYLDREPPEMLELADDLSRALGHYLKNGDDKDQDSIDAVRAAIPWLRFWARAGHGFVADY